MTHPATMVLVHGCGTDGHFWDELLPHLTELSVMRPSLPGRAETGGEALASAAENAEWLFAHLERSSVNEAVVVGHSFGGAVAIEMALRGRAHGVTVRGLGLVSTGARLRVAPVILEAVSAAVRTGVPAELGRFAYQASTDPALIERVESHARLTPVATTRQDWFSTNAFDRLEELGSIAVPTVIVSGTSDLLTPPKYARHLADNIDGARLELIDDAGHMLPVERPAELADLMLMACRSIKPL